MPARGAPPGERAGATLVLIALLVGSIAVFAELFYFAFGDGIWHTSDAFIVPVVAVLLPLAAAAIAIAALIGWNTRRAEGPAQTIAIIALILGIAVVATWGLWIIMTMLVLATMRPSPQPCNFTFRGSGDVTCCNGCGREHTGGCCISGGCGGGSTCCGGSGEGACCSGGSEPAGGSCCGGGSGGDSGSGSGGCCSSSSESGGSGSGGCCGSSGSSSGSGGSGSGGCCGSSSSGGSGGSGGSSGGSGGSGGCCGSSSGSSGGGSGGGGGGSSKGAAGGGALATVGGLAGALALRRAVSATAWNSRWASLRDGLAHHPDTPPYAHDCYRVAGVRLCIGCFTTFPLFALMTPILAIVGPPTIWAPMLAGGLALAATQGVSALGLAKARWQKVGVKTSLGVGLAVTVVALRNAPWPAAARAASILALAGLAFASTIPRRRRMARADAGPV